MDTNLPIFQYKILNNVLYLSEKLFRFKKISCRPLCSFCQSENELPIHFFHSYIKTSLLWYKLKKIVKAKIDLPVHTPQSAIFGFLNYENNSDIIKYYLFNSSEHKKLSLEVLIKEIVKICNIEKQICFKDFKKTKKLWKKWEIIGHSLQ